MVRWRLDDLGQRLSEEHGVSVSRQTLGRELRAMGYRKLSARPQAYGQDAQAIERKKNCADAVAEIRRRLAPGTRIEIWFEDDAPIGRKNKLTRRWAPRGTRPRAAHDQRTKWAYIFGAICPASGKGAALVIP